MLTKLFGVQVEGVTMKMRGANVFSYLYASC